ncbi:MAG TPA: tartrate-resistant acid phosphatase type 5 family protein, partial [Phenylobacterium sp.]
GAFLALGDWGRRGERDQTAVATAMGRAAAEVGSRFVLSAGDNFYPAGVQTADDDHWKESFEDVYAAPALQTPWLVSLGNHDYRGHPGAQLAYARTHARWRMPGRYYAVSGATLGLPQLDVFVLDTTPIDGGDAEALMRLSRGRVSLPDPDAQIAWFKAALARSRADWKVVVGHHPIRSGGHHGGSAALAAQIEPLLAAHNVQAYVCGHDHVLQHIQAGGTNHICTGAGSSAGYATDVEGTRFRASQQPGFALFGLDDAGLRLEFRDASGRSLYQTRLAQTPA